MSAKPARVIAAVAVVGSLITQRPSLAASRFGQQAAAGSDPIVQVTGGQVRGAWLEKGGAVFKGIPYARPPVGELRWREPMPLSAWSGVRPATEFGPPCAQKATVVLPRAAERSKEDCLYLNIWSAEWPIRTRKPVMVWIPGGGNYAHGANTAADGGADNGESLARHGVVLVAVNYRLGPFGFFSHPALTRESPHHASGNQGILDQLAALRWVHQNIERFGGNPRNVTIFGESAGSVDVSVLMTSPLSRGLFHHAIGESGSVLLAGEPLTLAAAEQRGQAAASRWHVPRDATVDRLRAIPAAEILDAEPNLLVPNLAQLFPNLGIVIDGYVFPRKPADVFAAGQEHSVPLLFGSNAREQIPGSVLTTDVKATIAATYGRLTERAQALYIGAADPDYGTPAEQWGTDTSFRCAAVAELMWHAAARRPAFEYEFARIPAGREALGSTHASEVSHVFGTLARGIFGVGPASKATDVDVRISDLMQQYWTNFAKNGNPNGPGLTDWPTFETSPRRYIQFTNAGTVVAAEGLRRPYCDLFIEHIKGDR